MTNGSGESGLIARVERLSSEVVDVTRDLIRFQSVNPPGNEVEIADYIYSYLNGLGFHVEKIEARPKRVNVVAKYGGLGPRGLGKTILFNGHTDVVPAGDLDRWTVNPFEGRVVQDKIIGRGAADMKGALASCLVAARAIVDSGVSLSGNMVIHAVADEENGSQNGTRTLIAEGLAKADWGVVMEGSVFKGRICVRTAVRGAHWIELETKGRAAHASSPSSGVNAILKMAKLLLALDDYQLKHRPHELLPSPTLAAGTQITGGVKENVIPPSCKATIDLRVLPGMTEKSTLDQIASVIRRVEEQDREVKVAIRTKLWWPSAQVDQDHEIVKLARKAGFRVSNHDVLPRGAAGSNDSAFLNIAGIPSVTFGPGDLETGNAHGADEAVEVEHLINFAKIYALMTLWACREQVAAQ